VAQKMTGLWHTLSANHRKSGYTSREISQYRPFITIFQERTGIDENIPPKSSKEKRQKI
jgi:hypothetical protein